MKRLGVLALLVLAGCSRATTPPLKISTSRELVRVSSVVVMPAVPDPEAAGEISDEATAAVTERLRQAVAQTRWHPLPATASAAKAKAPEERAGELAATAHADVAIGATIARYRERVGSAYGATEGASVSIQIFAVPAGRPQAEWRAWYAITQEPLAYNLWNFWGVLRGGPKWLTAEELAGIGIDEAVHRFAEAR